MKDFIENLLKCLNSEPDRETADHENRIMCRRLLLTGAFACLISLACSLISRNTISYSALLGAAGFWVIGSLFLPDREQPYKNATRILEVISVLILFLTAYVETSANRDQPLFVIILLLTVIPALIMDRPRKLLTIILLLFGITAFLSFISSPADIFTQNLNRLIPACFVSCVFCCYTAHNRIQMVKMHKTVRQISERDPLTGVLNRGGGSLMIRDCIAQQISGTFVIIDVDDFKSVNDTYGHQHGDAVLKKVADTLKNSFKSTDIVMRLGGDEFVVYVAGMADYQVAQSRLKTLVDHLHQIPVYDEPGNCISVSAGAVINEGSYPDYESLYKAADNCLYKAKEQGKNCFVLYDVSYKETDDK